MLNFIVLGYVPGTSVQLTFWDIVLFGGLLVSFGGLWYLRARGSKEEIRQLALSLISL